MYNTASKKLTILYVTSWKCYFQVHNKISTKLKIHSSFDRALWKQPKTYLTTHTIFMAWCSGGYRGIAAGGHLAGGREDGRLAKDGKGTSERGYENRSVPAPNILHSNRVYYIAYLMLKSYAWDMWGYVYRMFVKYERKRICETQVLLNIL